MRLKDYYIPLCLNIVAGVILYYVMPFVDKNLRLIVAAGFVIASLSTWALGFLRLCSLKRAGIIDILPSMTCGPGCTAELLRRVEKDFSFMGIAASKWINTGPLLVETIKKVGARNNKIHFLLLNPSSDTATRLSMTQYNNRTQIPEIISKSVQELKSLKKRGLNIDLHFYSFLPIFRIAIIDQRLAYVGFYRSSTSGEDSPQLVLDKNFSISYFQPFEEYFKQIWDNDSQEVTWDEY